MDSKYFDYSCEAQANAELRRREASGDAPALATLDARLAELQASITSLEAALERAVNQRESAQLRHANTLDELLAAQAAAKRLWEAMYRIGTGDEGSWNCHCPAGDIARAALATPNPD